MKLMAKRPNRCWALILLSAVLGHAASARPLAPLPLLHLDLEATSQELEAEYAKQQELLGASMPRGQKSFSENNLKNPKASASEDARLNQIVAVGKRNLDWLKYINSKREKPLSFTKPGSLGGIPIDKPKKYSGALSILSFDELVGKMDPDMKAILIDGKAFTDNPPIADDLYTEMGNKFDKIYQTVVRWKMAQPYLGYYKQAKANDIRGYYFLSQIKDLQPRLDHFSAETIEDQKSLQEWLESQCYNSVESETECRRLFAQALSAGKIWDFYKRYLPKAQQTFQELYDLQNGRSDVSWIQNGARDEAHIAIRNQSTSVLADFLKFNLEDEWKWNTWQLVIDFASNAAVQVFWQPGITPHVNGLGGSSVYMDSNAPLSEWDVQWTIRHEFGHVLGFPDCYVEFFDSSDNTMISYQIDITDLMCSRAGKLKERHFLDMRKNYAQPKTVPQLVHLKQPPASSVGAPQL